jgi:hypothetical protein
MKKGMTGVAFLSTCRLVFRACRSSNKDGNEMKLSHASLFSLISLCAACGKQEAGY